MLGVLRNDAGVQQNAAPLFSFFTDLLHKSEFARTDTKRED